MRHFVSTAVWVWLLLATITLNAQPPDSASWLDKLRAPDQQTRIQAIDSLGRAQAVSDEVIRALSELLKDESASIRSHAVYALANIGPPARAAIPRVVALATDPDVYVRRGVVRAIRRIQPGPEVSVPVLIRLMADPDADVRLRVSDTLTDQGSAAVPSLVDALENRQTRLTALLILGQLGPDAGKAMGNVLAIAAGDDVPLEVRREAMMTLGEMGEAAVPAVPQLIRTIQNPDLRSASIYALGRLGPAAREAEASLRQLTQTTDPFLQSLSLWALARLYPEDQTQIQKIVAQLAQTLKSRDHRVRQAAARALVDLHPNPEILTPALEPVLRGADEATLTAALGSLGQLGTKAVPLLVESLQYESLRPQVLEILGGMGEAAQGAVSRLTELLKVDDPKTRRAAAFALAEIGPAAKDAVPTLIPLLDTKQGNLRYAAAYALGRIGPDAIAAKPTLVQLINNDDEFMALTSAWAMARIDPQCGQTSPHSLPLFIRGLRSSDTRTRMESAASLRCLGKLAEPAVGELQNAMNDKNAFVRDMAAQALAAIRGEREAATPIPPESILPKPAGTAPAPSSQPTPAGPH